MFNRKLKNRMLWLEKRVESLERKVRNIKIEIHGVEAPKPGYMYIEIPPGNTTELELGHAVQMLVDHLELEYKPSITCYDSIVKKEKK